MEQFIPSLAALYNLCSCWGSGMEEWLRWVVLVQSLVSLQPSEGWRVCFQAQSHGWQEPSIPCHMDLATGLSECPHDEHLVTPEQWSQRESATEHPRQKPQCFCNLILEVICYHFCPILLVDRGGECTRVNTGNRILGGHLISWPLYPFNKCLYQNTGRLVWVFR